MIDYWLIDLVDSLYRASIIGSLYALMAVGLTLTMAISRVPNLAHAEFVTIGVFVGMVLTRYYSLGLVPTLVAATVSSAALALLSYYLVFRPLIRKGASLFILMVASFALSLMIRYLIYIVASAQHWIGIKAGIIVEVVAKIGFLNITNLFLWTLPTSIGIMLILHLLMQKTRLGKTMRAVADNTPLAKAIGVNINQIIVVTWALAGALAGLSGAFWVFFTQAHPESGWFALLRMIAASTIGGFYSLPATVIGGFIVGFAENTGMDILNRFFGLDFAFKPAVPVLIVVFVLLIRPTGLVGLSLRNMFGRWLKSQ
ncbi:MAG: branched-chain amino acid ABC transporter permease [Nitrososphaerales archaeon]